MIGRIIGGFALVGFGVFLVIKSEWMLQNFGAVAWAEENLGYDGGTRLFYKLLGVLCCFIGLAIVFGLFGGTASSLAPYFGGQPTAQ